MGSVIDDDPEGYLLENIKKIVSKEVKNSYFFRFTCYINRKDGIKL